MRLLPDTVRVAIAERTPVAFVQVHGRIELADANGVILTMTPQQMAQQNDQATGAIARDIGGKLPGFTVKFVKHVIADASGNTIKLPGKRFVLITLRPAQAHKASGAPTISGKVHKPGFPMLKAWVLAGDDEGVVSFGIGLGAATKVRVGKVAGRIFLDFKE